MSIKSDRWIRRMASEHAMIEPFEPGQVRQAPDGQRIVSYGTSSYGYDIRCAPEFKVFTNIYSTVVDPKNFDEKSFVDIQSDVCVIPPNSFALAIGALANLSGLKRLDHAVFGGHAADPSVTLDAHGRLVRRGAGFYSPACYQPDGADCPLDS